MIANPRVLARDPERADQIARRGRHPVRVDIALLVPVRVELHTALLHQDTAVMLARVEGAPRKIASHAVLVAASQVLNRILACTL